MKLFLHINIKKIETVIPYVDNYLWNVGIQKKSNKLYHMRNDPSIFNCKSQYKNVGLGQYKNVGFPTLLYCLF